MLRAELSLPYAVIDEEPKSLATVARRRGGLQVTDRFAAEVSRISSETNKVRRLEDWIVTMLGEDAAKGGDDWEDIIGRVSPAWVPKKTRTAGAGSSKVPGGWERFRLVRRKGISVVALSDRALIKEQELSELAGDLLALVEAGHHRIIVNFSAVERLSTWAGGFLAEAIRRCDLASEGALKVCGLRPELAAIFPVTGLGRGITIFDDETTAIDSTWPDQPQLLPLPVDVLTALTRATNAPPEADVDSELADDPETNPGVASPYDLDVGTRCIVWLISRYGSPRGRALPIEASRFVIGRDPGCDFRPDAPSVSRIHAQVEHRGSRIFLRDLGSAHGTHVNGRILRGEETELFDGDEFQLGPVSFTLAIGANGGMPAAIEDLVNCWLREDDSDEPGQVNETGTDEFLVMASSDGQARFKSELIEDVVVVTPLTAELDGEVALGKLRGELQALFDRDLPHRIVINLTHVGHLSGRAIGILLAHHLKLDQAGGALRVCQAHARVGALLEQVHLGMLVECYPTLEDAVLAVWPRTGEQKSTSAV
jgi:anti-anti-sigma factor